MLFIVVLAVFVPVLSLLWRRVQSLKNQLSRAERSAHYLAQMSLDSTWIRELLSQEPTNSLETNLQRIAENFLQYRPFLPGYLFLRDDDRSKGPTDTDEAPEDLDIALANQSHPFKNRPTRNPPRNIETPRGSLESGTDQPTNSTDIDRVIPFTSSCDHSPYETETDTDDVEFTTTPTPPTEKNKRTGESPASHNQENYLAEPISFHTRGRSHSTASSIGHLITKVFTGNANSPNNSVTLDETSEFSEPTSNLPASKIVQKSDIGLKKKHISVCVIDIQDFHKLIEQLSEEDIAFIHSEYIELISRVVRSYKGVVTYVIGDKIFCSWSASNYVINHALQAVQAAYVCRTRMSKLSSRWLISHKYPRIKINVSVCSGWGLCGITGKATIRHFSILGPLFNEVIAFSKLNKIYHTRMLVNEECFKKVRSHYLARLVDIITINTQKELQDRCLFEIFREKSSEMTEWMYMIRRSQMAESLYENYNQAWIFYTEGKFDEAKTRIDTYLQNNPHDAHALRLKSRIVSQRPPHDNPTLQLQTQLHKSSLHALDSEFLSMGDSSFVITPTSEGHDSPKYDGVHAATPNSGGSESRNTLQRASTVSSPGGLNVNESKPQFNQLDPNKLRRFNSERIAGSSSTPKSPTSQPSSLSRLHSSPGININTVNIQPAESFPFQPHYSPSSPSQIEETAAPLPSPDSSQNGSNSSLAPITLERKNKKHSKVDLAALLTEEALL